MKEIKSTERKRTLFLSFLLPSFFGSGPQIRAAALLKMLSTHQDVYLLVLRNHETTDIGLSDDGIEQSCVKILSLNLQSSADKHISALIKDYYDENRLNSLFIFRMESYGLMGGGLDAYPLKFLDLDELGSRRNKLIADLKAKTGIVPSNLNEQSKNVILTLLEKKIIPQFSKVFVASETEATELREHINFNNIAVLPNIFPSRINNSRQPAENPQEILFVGSFFYYPNEDAVHYFCREIFPLIRKKMDGNVIFRIVGFAPPASLSILKKEHDIHLMGYQERLEDYYSTASLAVVPLRAGTGTRIKILEAFAHECPVVSTSIGAMGLKVTNSENILLGDHPETFAQACLQILGNPALASRLAKGGQRLHQDLYSMDSLCNQYAHLSSV